MDGTEAAGAERTISRLRRQLWLERSLFLVLVAGLLLAAFRSGSEGKRVCLIAVDGRPLAVVGSHSEAERMLDEIRSAAAPSGRKVEFAQKVTLHSVPAKQNPVQGDAEVIGILSEELQLTVEGTAVLADGEVVFALPSQGEAVKALSLLLSEFSPDGDDVSAAFKEQIKVEPRPIPVDKYFASPPEALAAIVAGTRSGETHVVAGGETAWGIAQRLGVPLNRLAQANPEVDLDLLRVGEKLTLPVMRPPITVVARREIREEVGEGAQRRTRAVRLTYENGVEVKREVIGQRRMPARTPTRLPTREQDPYRWRDEVRR